MSLPVAAGGAMTIAEYGHVDPSGQESYQTYQVGEDRTLYG